MIKNICYVALLTVSYCHGTIEPLDMVASQGVCGSNISNPDDMLVSYQCVIDSSKALTYPSSTSSSAYEMMTVGSDIIPNLSSNLFSSRESGNSSSSTGSSSSSSNSDSTSSNSTNSSSSGTLTSPSGY